MKELEFEIERDQIEMSYNQQLSQYDSKLLELDAQDADLKMRLAGNTMERCRLVSLRQEIERSMRDELLKLKREYMLNRED